MKVSFRDLGQMDYKACWDLQQTLFDSLTARKRPAADTVRNATGTESSAADAARKTDGAAIPAEDAGTILLVEHPPVYTLGKSGRAENLLIPKAALEAMGAKFFHHRSRRRHHLPRPGAAGLLSILDLECLGIGLRDYIGALEEAVHPYRGGIRHHRRPHGRRLGGLDRPRNRRGNREPWTTACRGDNGGGQLQHRR